MDGCGTKDLPGYKYGTSTPAFGGNTSTSSGFGVQDSQMEDEKGLGIAPGGSAVEELVESSNAMTTAGGRKKKKKHKSGEDSSASAKSSSAAATADDELVDAVLPMLSEGQDVDSLLFPSTLPPSGGTMVGGQYLLNNSLLDQILTEKKMQILQSPEVIEFLRKQVGKK